ncbi:NAD(P)H dehydrogenase (quinone) FQR1-like [Impatiens glandulifera]|uniref:NAD(P)H dehydrogenase (quinone) FQR1-like n=1 Tax=Impatiens glandulifera TaxID=253017 RepID=UPI001FB123FB|nr:NAD(P)H dehydrogenase (quinone) FQR1-like [Impatiens glandulifera]
MATKVYIVYYSTYGHVARLAEEIKRGADSVEGIEADIMVHPRRNNNVPIIKPDQLADADAFIFGFPTRFGMMPAQFRTFIDLTGAALGSSGACWKSPPVSFLARVLKEVVKSRTALTAITFVAHHGMIFVPIGKPLSVKQPPPDVVKRREPLRCWDYIG